MADDAAKQIGGDGTQHFKVRARLALIKKQFKEAERIYLENNALDEAIEMYQTIHKWESAIELAKATNYRDLENLKAKYYRNLYETGQEEKAAQIKESEGDYTAALDLYLKSNQPALAAKLVLENSALYNDDTVVERVALELVKAEIFDRAGELFEQTKQFQRALESYRKGKNFNKAIHVARFSFPEQVVQLEEEWGDSLMQEGQYDAAVSHYIEAGNSLKATDAAIFAKEWDKALEILRNLESGPETDKFYARIANHFEAEGQYTEAEKYYIEANMPKEAIEMYNKASKWAEAYKLATEFMEVDATQAMYLEKAEELEHAGRLKEAEDLYISIGDPTRAIAMYKEANRLEEMMRLVERFHTDRVNDTHKRLAEDLEDKGDFQAAEEQYLLAGDWKAAVNMYKEHEQWADAYRVAKAEGSERAHKQVVYMWAKSLGGDAAVRLLQRYGMLAEAIDVAIEKGEFEFGFELCRLGANERLADVQSSYALQLEDQGDFVKAERFYLEAGKAREAVLMHMHNQDWQAAERLASAHCTDMLVDIYISQARAALEVRDHDKAESYLLRANKADIILKYYKEMGMWQDALRIAKEYMPDMLQQLQNEYDEELLRSGAKGAQSFMHQALQWEREGEYQRAIECYMKVDEPVTSDVNQISTAWAKAGELVIRFMKDDGSAELNRIGHRLSELGQSNAAGELYLHANKPNEAIQAFIEGQEWAKAKTVAKELMPEMEEAVDEAYREFLRNQGRVGELIDVDVVSAIDILVERGQWEKALMTARQQNHRPLLDKYLAMRATELINMDQLLEAVNLFEKFGTSTNTQNFNIYKKLIDSLVNSRDASYEMYAGLRNMIVDLLDKIAAAADDVDPRIAQVQRKSSSGTYTYFHFYALRKALEETGAKEAERIRLHESVALVRYIDLLQPDKVFYDAGMACRKAGGNYENMAFLFLNQYLDVVEAIEANDASIVDNSVFEGTDVPQQFSLPQSAYLSPEEHEEVKEWVLSVSVDQRVQPALSVDENGRYEASTVDQDGNVFPVCVISGYPVLHSGHDFGNGKMADSDAWQAFVTLTKTNASDELFDVQQFLTRWSGTPSLSH
ncbi:hypothetical protein AAVH_12667 [Aphelenchoides avenae]|nr:hypothetical protein AAVH_12667 [Aphelenchus avenae]